VKLRFIDCDDNALADVLACLELPKYRLWLPIELSFATRFSRFYSSHGKRPRTSSARVGTHV
jgi:hypothetical protein